MSSKNNVLAMLGVAATNLVATQTAAIEVAEEFQFGLRHHSYEEEGLPESLGGSTDRYDINVNQFSIISPLSEKFDIALTYQHEKMSGASPWYTIMGADEKPVQIMSGASIEDKRTDASAKVRYVLGVSSFALTAAVSDEDDYKSESFGVGYVRESVDKLSTWSFSADVSNDDINPVDADIYTTRPNTEQSKRSTSALISYSHILNKNTLLQVGAGYSKKTGFLSDPYKMVIANLALIGDSRPSRRYAKTLSSRLRYFVDASDSALHFDYRYYHDSWKIKSHTLSFAWYQNLPMNFQLVPSVRLYSQSESFFYDVFYSDVRADGFYSTDYRLSEYGATTYGLKVIKAFDNWSITLSADKYSSGGSTGFASESIENPALLDFKLVSLGFDLHF
ncbi:DUF3570 domain-containing protein [Paraglaciecola aquimarina]|uniref:DUF3570 domain-containing protein n=1 Tax=Paraglaciecola algarum TaxID=3050085 RepID=A0ABS9D6A0_9ALTE|nr:DUF3570 domain-containing protein [Paraglaciecola sp. G1-23]MCF2948453.1 DUF3570 domain-containing protein [Paraglaciecola sp. G1-23]